MKRQEQFHCRFLDYRLLGSCLLSCLLICLARTTLHASESNFNALNDTIAADVALPDSLLTDDNVYRYTFSNFPLACRIMDELRIRKLLPTHRLDITEGDLYFNNGHYRHALKNYRRALESDSIRQNDDEYMDQLHRLISTYDCLHNEVGKAECVNLLLDKAKATGNQPMHSIALFNLGKMIYYQGNKSQGYEYMHQAVDLMFHTDYEYKYDNLRYNYNTLLVMQQRDKLYEEALSTLDALQSVVTREQGGEPQMQGLEQKELKALYAHRAVVLQRLGRHKEAEEFYKKFLTVSHVHSRDNYLIMPYLFDRRMYDEIIRMNTTREQFLISQRDSVNYHMVTIKRTLGEAYASKGDYRRSTHYYKQLSILCDSIKKREERNTALELAAIYDTTEKEALLQQQANELRERNILLISAICIMLLLCAGLALVVRYTLNIRRKNRAMVRSINEEMNSKKRLSESRDTINALQQKIEQMKTAAECRQEDNMPDLQDHGTEDDEEKDNEPKREYNTLEQIENHRIFDLMEGILSKQSPYLDPKFSRHDLCMLSGTNRTRLNVILMQCTGVSSTAYINNLRLEHAVELIREHPEYIISHIAEECGLPNASTFHRLFRERYDMTPNEYRNAIFEK